MKLFLFLIFLQSILQSFANDLAASPSGEAVNVQPPVYESSASLNNYNWLSGATGVSPDLSSSSSFSDTEDVLIGEGGSYSRRKYRRKGNKKRNKNKRRNKFRNKDYNYGIVDDEYDDNDEYYDRDDGYGAPHAPASSYGAPEESYDAPSYSSAPSDSYGAPSYGGGGDDGFNDFLNALAAFLPIGLFLAAIPPNLITISTKKKRSASEDLNEVEYPFLDRIVNEIGFDQMMSKLDCQKRIFCEMSEKGQNDLDANFVQKAFNFVALMSPKVVSDRIGTTEVFEAVKRGNCSIFKCS